jgi:hypothetical protein
MAHEDFIKIRNLEESPEECFQGFFGSSSSGGGEMPTAHGQPWIPEFPGEPPITPIEPGGSPATQQEKAAFDMKSAWNAQKKLTGTMINFMDALDPGENTAAGNIITDYVSLLDSSKAFSASLEAFSISRDTLAELASVLAAIDRKPSKELIDIVDTTDGLFGMFKDWLDSGLDAVFNHSTAAEAVIAAQKVLAAAQTEEEVVLATAEVALVEQDESTAWGLVESVVGTLPAVISIIDKLDLAALIGNVVKLNPTALALIAGKFLAKVALDWFVQWLQDKVTRKNPIPTCDLQPIINALRDIALQEKTIGFGDNMSLHTKAEVLNY